MRIRYVNLGSESGMRIWYTNPVSESLMRIFDAIIEYGSSKTTILPVPEADKKTSPHLAIILHFNGTYSEVMQRHIFRSDATAHIQK